MSKQHQPHGRAEDDTARGELRKPDDQSDQPGQGADLKPPASQLESVHTELHDRPPPAIRPDDPPEDDTAHRYERGDN